MGRERFRLKVSLSAPLIFLVTFSVLFACGVEARAQAKPERQSKAAKGAKAEQSAPAELAQTGQTSASGEAASDAAEPSKPEEKAFKGM